MKGRFSSLKGLRVQIRSKEDHKFATQWIVACVSVHAFAMDHEAMLRAQRGEDEDSAVQDPFVQEGIDDGIRFEQEINADDDVDAQTRRNRLSAGKAKREELRDMLFESLIARAAHRTRC